MTKLSSVTWTYAASDRFPMTEHVEIMAVVEPPERS